MRRGGQDLSCGRLPLTIPIDPPGMSSDAAHGLCPDDRLERTPIRRVFDPPQHPLGAAPEVKDFD